MIQREPGTTRPRFEVELTDDGVVGIRDRATGTLHLTTSLDDAGRDVDYLSSRAARGDEDEIARHLAFNDETARRLMNLSRAGKGTPHHDEQRHTPTPQKEATPKDRLQDPGASDPALQTPLSVARAQAEEWTVVQDAIQEAERIEASVRIITAAADSLAAATQADVVATTALTSCTSSLFADPAHAQAALTESLALDGIDYTCSEVASNPSSFSMLADLPARRFGENSYRQAIADLAVETSTALRTAFNASTTLHDAITDAYAIAGIPRPFAANPSDAMAMLKSASEDLKTRLPKLPQAELRTQLTNALRASVASLADADRDALFTTHPSVAALSPAVQKTVAASTRSMT